jgi:23S rRNA (uracil1939-C5)-methyltransferase
MVTDSLQVTAGQIVYGGHALARHGDLVIFIPLAAPGDRLLVSITEYRKNFARASIEKILEPSPVRRKPLCEHFGQCGGCQLQHIKYEAQLEAKIAFVREALARMAKIEVPDIEIRSAAEYGYRTRARLKIEGSSCGFNRSNSHSICDIKDCPVLVQDLRAALSRLRSAGRASPGGPLWIAAGDCQVSFQPAPKGFPSGALRRTIAGATYRFSPSVFFQANAHLIEELIWEALLDYSGKLAIELYAGVGLFTVQLARRFECVIAVEADARAARFARENLSANALFNATVHNLRAEEWLRRCGLERPDLIILDPPRSGAKGLLREIISVGPRFIVYVSCNPTTLARDLRELLQAGYKLNRVTALDLFPQTYHVEAVAHLELTK